MCVCSLALPLSTSICSNHPITQCNTIISFFLAWAFVSAAMLSIPPSPTLSLSLDMYIYCVRWFFFSFVFCGLVSLLLLTLIPRVQHSFVYLFIYVCDNSLFCCAINWHIDPSAKSMVALVGFFTFVARTIYMCKCQIIIIATAANNMMQSCTTF